MLRILITPLVSSNSSYKKQELLTPRLISTRFFGGVRVAHLFIFFVWSYYVSLRSEFRVVVSVAISA